MIKATVILGEEAVREYEEYKKIPSGKWLEVHGGVVKVKEFDTKNEYEAYSLGLTDADGWSAKLLLAPETVEDVVDNYRPKVGDKIWLAHIDRRDKDRDRYVEVIKIGKKYLYANIGYGEEIRFNVDTLRHENGKHSSRYRLFISKETSDYILETQKRRLILSTRLSQFLTDREVNDLYSILIQRDK